MWREVGNWAEEWDSLWARCSSPRNQFIKDDDFSFVLLLRMICSSVTGGGAEKKEHLFILMQSGVIWLKAIYRDK